MPSGALSRLMRSTGLRLKTRSQSASGRSRFGRTVVLTDTSMTACGCRPCGIRRLHGVAAREGRDGCVLAETINALALFQARVVLVNATCAGVHRQSAIRAMLGYGYGYGRWCA